MRWIVRISGAVAMSLLGGACARQSVPVTPPAPKPAPTPSPAHHAPPEVHIDRAELPPVNPHLPPVPHVAGPLRIQVVYPPRNAIIGASRDSNFVFGSIGNGQAGLRINGVLVPVWPNGAFMGWVKNPPAGKQEYDLMAYTATDTARLVYPVRTWDAIPSQPHTPETFHAVTPPERATLHDDSLSRFVSDTDQIIIGRPSPRGTYEWFLFQGTRVKVDGYFADMARIELDPNRRVWVDRQDLKFGLRPSQYHQLHVTKTSIVRAHDWIDLRLSVSSPPPYIVQETENTLTLVLYNSATSKTSLAVPRDPYLTRATVSHSRHRVVYTFVFSRPVYGYLALYRHGIMTFRMRRPPVVDPANPLRGMTIAIDAGHPPAGATGPTGLYEADANLAVAERVEAMLKAKGAHVVMTRTDANPVALGARPIMARRVNANALVSIHQNALPDGMDPFQNDGTGTYYFHSHSKRFATLMQRSLVSQLGLRDLGTFQKNLALARPTWMPAVLTEGTFIIMPDEEAALRTPEYQNAYARGVVEGLEQFFATFTQ